MNSKKKYVVLSFDDARDNFYHNVFPLLEENNIKCTLNVVTGLVDGTVKPTEFHSCTKEQLAEIKSCGHEIASHSNSHMPTETIDDMYLSIKKIKDFLNYDAIGCAMPFNQNLSKTMKESLANNGIRYVRLGYRSSKKSIKKLLFMILFKIFHFKCFYFKVLSDSCFEARHYKNKKEPLVFYSINIGSFSNISCLIDFLSKRKSNSFTIIMLHSVHRSLDEIKNDSYPQGSILVNDFLMLLNFLKKDDNIEVLRNEDILSFIKE